MPKRWNSLQPQQMRQGSAFQLFEPTTPPKVIGPIGATPIHKSVIVGLHVC